MRHFERALEIEPRFVLPRLFIAAIHQSAGSWEQASATIAPLTNDRQRPSRYERSLVDHFVAIERGWPTEALVSILAVEQLSQVFVTNFMVGTTQLQLNRPAATLATFAKLPPDPEWAGRRVGAAVWRRGFASIARHLLGDFETDLREAKEGQKLAPYSFGHRVAEARALIGLGKPTEAVRLVDDMLTMPGSPGPPMLSVARALRAHGRHQPSLELATRTVEWYRARPPNVVATEATQAGLASALYAAEKWEDVQHLAQVLADRSPEKPEYAGMLGVVAARRGNMTEAKRRSDVLGRLSQPYLFGSHIMWRARIAAVLSEQTSAVALLRDAIAQGPPSPTFWLDLHRDMDFEPLKKNPAFRELTRPKE